MQVLTNKLELVMNDENKEKFDAKFDIFKVTKKSEGYLPFSSRVLEKYDNPSILAVRMFKSSEPFYILSLAGDIDEGELRSHFENMCKEEIDGEEFEDSSVALSLLPKKVSVSDVPKFVVVQLLMSALRMADGEGNFKPAYQNVTGRLFNLGQFSTKGQKKYGQVIALEFVVNGIMEIEMHVRTFTSCERITSPKVKGKNAHYVFDYNGPSLRRKSPGEKVEPRDEFINRKVSVKKKNRIPFLKYSNLKGFKASKCGMLFDLIERFNNEYKGIAQIKLKDPVEATRMSSKVTIDVKRWLADREVKLVDLVSDSDSARVCKEISQTLASEDLLGKAVEVVHEPVKGALNLVVIHEKAHYEKENISDPHDAYSDHDYYLQHVTIEAFKDSDDEGSILGKCLLECMVKADVDGGRITLYDWVALEQESPIVFVSEGPSTDEEKASAKRGSGPKRLSFMEVFPDGHFEFGVGESKPLGELTKYDEWYESLIGEWKFFTEGFIIRGSDVNVIERTTGYPLPDLNRVNLELQKFEWSFSKDEILALFEDAELRDRIVAGKKSEEQKEHVKWEWAILHQGISESSAPKFQRKSLRALIGEIAKKNDMAQSRSLTKLMDTLLLSAYGKSVLAGMSRNKDLMAEVFPSLRGMLGYWNNGCLYYWVNETDEKTQPKAGGLESTSVIRKVRAVGDSEVFFVDLVDTLVVPFVRHKRATVVPFPFKYLREWTNSFTFTE